MSSVFAAWDIKSRIELKAMKNSLDNSLFPTGICFPDTSHCPVRRCDNKDGGFGEVCFEVRPRRKESSTTRSKGRRSP